jgi:NAD(P)H-hydrate epimerase
MERVDVLPRIPPRAPDSHKGTYGRVLILAGSAGMPGAASLAALAALRTGSGLVTVALPASISLAVAANVPEATQILLPDEGSPAGEGGRLVEALGADFDRRHDAAAVGPGLGTGERARALVEAALRRFAGPLVVDADALNILAASPDLAGPARANRVFTPHPGELERLTGEKPKGEAERVAAAARLASRFGCVAVLKGHRTVVVEGDRYAVNETGNPGMATGGSGDVLTGIIASLLGQGFAPFEAARLGVHLHGSAGDIAADAQGQASVIAGDIIDCLPDAIRKHGA